MKARGTQFALRAALFLIVPGYAMPLRAGQIIPNAEPHLVVCNKGTVAVEAVSATRKDDPTRSSIIEMMTSKGKYYWSVEGVTISPGACTKLPRNEGEPAYIAFGFTDSKGAWGSGKIAQVPDFGTVSRPDVAAFLQDPRDPLHKDLSVLAREGEVLVGAARVMCARKDATGYNIPDDFQTDCATLTLTGRGAEAGHGPFLPLTSTLLYHPTETDCSRAAPYTVCSGAEYYLNIAPKPGDRDLHATVGTSRGEDAEPSDPDLNDPAKALKKLREATDALRLKQVPACNVITAEEAEQVLGVSIDPPEPGRAVCRYQEPGYGTDASKKKQVTIGIFRSTVADPEAVNARRNFIINDKSLLPLTYKEVPNFGDTAFWVWAGGYYGALYVLKGGTLEVAVKISGVPENVALSTAKRFATRVLGSSGKTSFVYAARKDH